MSTFLNVDLVKYLCSCGKKRPICKLYLCRYCLKVRCGDCVLHEVDTPFCPNCLEHMPSAEAKLKKNGCSSCFDCPSCGHILSNRATSMSVPDPENPGKTTPKRMFYMVCGFCRWSTRDSGIPDKSVASGGLEDPENPHAKTIFSLLGSYQQISKREKAEKDKKKYVRRRSYWNYSANMDKYGLISVAAKRKGFGNTTSTSVKDEEELAVTPITASEPVKMFDPLPEDIFTEALQLDKVTTIGQRHSAPQFQPAESEAMFPLHKHLLIRKSLRCKECEHNLSKPEYNPISTKFKIQLIALHHIPEIRIFAPPDLHMKKESKLILTLCNPSAYNTTVSFLQAEQDDFHNTKVELPKHPVVVLHRDEAAMYDVTNQTEENFKDDASVIAFRKANKIGFYVKVKPDVLGEDVKITFRVQHEYRNTAVALPTEKQELQNVSLTHTVYINLGQVKQGK